MINHLVKEGMIYIISFMKWFGHNKYCNNAIILVTAQLFRLKTEGLSIFSY